MILNHVADRAGRIIKGASAFDSEVFRHRDLHAFDIITIPERFQERVCETGKEHVMHWPFPFPPQDGRLNAPAAESVDAHSLVGSARSNVAVAHSRWKPQLYAHWANFHCNETNIIGKVSARRESLHLLDDLMTQL